MKHTRAHQALLRGFCWLRAERQDVRVDMVGFRQSLVNSDSKWEGGLNEEAIERRSSSFVSEAYKITLPEGPAISTDPTCFDLAGT